MTGAIVTSPFDVVKTRLQSDLFREASHPPPPTSATNFLPHRIRPVVAAATRPTGAGGLLWNFVETAQMIRNISVNEGWKALFKGLGPTLVGVVPARAINFSTYAQSKILIAGWFPQLGVGAGESAEASPYVHLSAATIAGITTATATNPIWVVKTRLQLEAKHEENMAKRALKAKASSAGQVVGVRNYSTTAGQRPMLPAFRMTADILRQEGVAGLYKGLSASLIGVSEGVIQWTLYEVGPRASLHGFPALIILFPRGAAPKTHVDRSTTRSRTTLARRRIGRDRRVQRWCQDGRKSDHVSSRGIEDEVEATAGFAAGKTQVYGVVADVEVGYQGGRVSHSVCGVVVHLR